MTRSIAFRPSPIPRFFGKLLPLGTALVALVATFPSALAGGADGVYRVTKVSGNFKVNGRTVSISKSDMRNALLRGGKIEIKNDSLPLYKWQWEDLMENFNVLGIDGDFSASGPRRVKLREVNGGFTGTVAKPVRLKLEGRFLIHKVKLAVKSKVRARVAGGRLTITAPVKIEGYGGMVKGGGKITLTAWR